ncbi:MAG: arsenic efflux protein [Clostridia bacterium]|nr:arsenic efflux protein [Clostridia bacterium]
MGQVLLEALIDSAKMLPFLLAIYLIIELIETNKKAKLNMARLLGSKWSALFGGIVGTIPQCGFSVLSADLYTQRYLNTGTLLAVLIASSDEALPLLLASKQTFVSGAILLATKLVYAVLVGYLVNIFDKRPLSYDFSLDQSAEGCCQHDMHHKPTFWQFVKHPLIHTAKIFAYLLVLSVGFGALMHYASDGLSAFLQQTYWLQPVVCALVGLIPNCAGSVLLATLYADGLISFGALASGLACSSGLAFTILLKNKSTLGKTPIIALLLYVFALLFGYAINLVMLAI